MHPPLTTELLLSAYCSGLFPMADPDDDGRISWYAPDPRAILPLDGLHISKSLARTVRQGKFEVSVDRAFENVMRMCAESAPGRETTWISEELIGAYSELHERDYAHSVECRRDGELAGGLYGVAIGGAFFAESMFSRSRDASKVALAHLVERLQAGRFVLLDVQMNTPHLARLGAVVISRSAYGIRLARALTVSADWNAIDTVG
ncbi:MAG: leucyl/phenylalanyl-tRNA--protein transferase [Bacteroidetes bacterium]|nr:leucyl/phenylalanyl-tRNA--protein transferase [Bacteroidota bacterium]